MATSSYSLHVYRNSVHTQKSGFCTTSKNQKLQGIVNFNIVKAKVSSDSDSDQNTKPKSVICGDCNGNGAVLCSQCKGKGVNSVDFFNGQFKAGDSCWLCGGKKDMLCGNCNGAGFIGGFMNSFDN